MSNPYEPTSAYDAYPVLVGFENALPETFNRYYRNIFDKLHYLKTSTDEINYINTEILENLNNNIGDGITTSDVPTYPGANFLVTGPHHTGLLKLDTEVMTNRAAGVVNTAAINNNNTLVNNIAAKIHANTTLGPAFTWDNTNIIVQNEQIKPMLERFDRYLITARRNANLVFAHTFENTVLLQTPAVVVSIFDVFVDATKVHVLTDSTLDHEYQTASEDDTYVYYNGNAGGGNTIDRLTIDWDKSTAGSVEVKYNCKGVFDWSTMSDYASKGEKVTIAGVDGGIDLYVAFKLIGNAQLYNIRIIAAKET